MTVLFWIAGLFAGSGVIMAILVGTELRKRYKAQEGSLGTLNVDIRLREVQVQPTFDGQPLQTKPQLKMTTGRAVLYILSAPFILLLLFWSFLWVLIAPQPTEAEVRADVKDFVAKTRAKLMEARKARVFEQVLISDVRAARAEARLRRRTVWHHFTKAFTPANQMAAKEHKFFKSTYMPHLHEPDRK